MPKLPLPFLFSLISQFCLGNQAVVETNAPIVTLHSPGFNTPITAPVAVNLTVQDATLTEWRLSAH